MLVMTCVQHGWLPLVFNWVTIIFRLKWFDLCVPYLPLQVLSRRTITSEETISAVLSSMTRKYRTGLSAGALSVIENRDKEESEELSKAAYLEVETTLSLPGRLSGSVEWRKARS